MNSEKKKSSRSVEKRLILEMIDASMRLSEEKGPHPLVPGCTCISCVNKRKRIIAGKIQEWRWRL